MQKMKSLFYLVIGLLLCGVTIAQPINPGTYWYGGYGALKIQKASTDGVQSFEIHSDGANGHSCDADGLIKNKKMAYKVNEESCHLIFEPISNHSIKVSTTCIPYGVFCGARANLEGIYEVPPAICLRQKQVKNDFIKRYKSKDFEKALATLEPYFARCEGFTNWIEEYDIRNDLAVTYHKLNRFDQCLKVLEPFSKIIEQSAEAEDDQIEALIGSQPSFEEVASRLLKAARTNLRLCDYKFPVTAKKKDGTGPPPAISNALESIKGAVDAAKHAATSKK
jgi:hypothetical protein